MQNIAIAFTVTADPTSKARYVSELIAIRGDDQGHEIGRLHLQLGDGGPESIQHSLAAQVSELNTFIGAAPIFVRDGAMWKRFLRGRSPEQVKQLLGQTTDVTQWSRRNYPRQRNDLASLLKRLKLTIDGSLAGLERDAVALARIAPMLRQPAAPTVVLVSSGMQTPPSVPPLRTDAPHPRPGFRERLRLAWCVLRGDA